MNHVQAMEREITKRRQVIELLGQGKKYYDRWRKFWWFMKKSFRTIVFSVCMGRQRSSPLPTAILVRGWKRQEQEREILILDMPSCFHQSASQVAVKLKEKSEELSSSSSPVPSPDYDAPSPAGSGHYKSNRRFTQQNLYECCNDTPVFPSRWVKKRSKWVCSGDEMEIRLPDEQAGAGEVDFLLFKTHLGMRKSWNSLWLECK